MLRLLGIRKNRCSGSLVALLGNYLFDYPGDGDGGCDYDDGGGGDDDADGDDGDGDDGGGDGDDHDDHDDDTEIVSTAGGSVEESSGRVAARRDGIPMNNQAQPL